MKILALTDLSPVPSSDAGSPRLFEFMNVLAKRHELTLGLIKGKPHKEAHRVFQNVEVASCVPERISLHRRFMHSISGRAYCDERIRRPAYHRALQSWIEKQIEKYCPDMLYFSGLASAVYLPENLSIPVCVDFVDALELLFDRKASLSQSALERFRLSREASALKKLQLEIARKAQLSLFISPVDEQTLDGEGVKTAVVPNGVASDYFSFKREGRKSDQILFFGVLGYEPNIDAARFICEEILPEIRKMGENPRVLLVGHHPKEQVLALSKLGQIEVLGDVPDMRPYLWDSTVFLCPMRIGAGLKNKILIAASAGLPTVATSLALEGIAFNSGKEIFIADKVEDIAKATVSLLKNPSLQTEIAHAACETVAENYSWEIVGKRLEYFLLSLIESS